MARTRQRIEVNNRFELLASLSVDNEPEESVIVNDISPDEKQVEDLNDEQTTKNPWEIPDYIEKPIPSLSPITTTTKPVRKTKTSAHVHRAKPSVDVTECDEQQDEIPTSAIVEIPNQPTTYTCYPPQPYKFKQTPAKHNNPVLPKINRKTNALPKHSASRGNTKACTHKI